MSYLVRADDFPRMPTGSQGFESFNSIMEKHGIHYLLGVIPLASRDALNPDCKDFAELTKEQIKMLKSAKYAEIAMHGLTHQTTRKEFHSEFFGIGEKEAGKKLVAGKKILQKKGLNPRIFIPPFNTFGMASLQAIKKHFSALTGGPETERIFGHLPIGNLDGIMYVPSYRPFYGKASDILRAVKRDRTKGIKCITLHWAWDMENNFKNTEKLAHVLEGKVISWNLNMLQTSS